MNPGPQIKFYLFNKEYLPVTDTLIVGWVSVILILILAKYLTSNLKMRPEGKQNVAEMIIELIYDQIEPMLPNEGWRFLPFIATIFIYVGFSNLIGLVPGVTSPTGDLNTTLGLALVVFIVVQLEGMREHGVWGYIKSFAEPVIFLLPINVIGELAKPISHSFRLFGNIVGGGIIMTLIYQAAPALVPVPLHAWFDFFVGMIQALIFGMVAIAYISVAKS
ncbi:MULTISPECIES: F0F1 ATP synthase subunit A [unclassified Halanaerobium]|uniref:F0F1 ATP synthase subunit A n=1 Tax=unclassified Halanaerobium TaxID=2641197 RepID=UPI000DF1C290|nr:MULTISPECIES: F0F1 ATP synthase subunit A [unclassified Halanaerobium]RCW48265.1 ATP synthase F0 subcomplex A subunit [Halanaerobium sp. MA284_MarDTE_T2]RCW85692.1 ATP synthase F0 subcomplex A subunit [Halanaerobium sp. DL-01]